MRNIFILFIFIIFISFEAHAEGWIQLNLNDWDSDSFFHGVSWIQKVTLIICLALGPWQFSPRLYRKNPLLHYALGNVYVMVSLLLAAPSSMVLAFKQPQIPSVLFLFIIAALWWWSTRRGIFHISNKNWMLHLEWMICSYITVCTAALYMFSNQITLTVLFFVLAFAAFLFLRQMKIHQKLLKAFFTHS